MLLFLYDYFYLVYNNNRKVDEYIMKKNGFTLVELLAVIVIMAILLTVAVPAVIGISNSIKKNMFCSKVENIEAAAKNYAADYIDYFDDHPDGLTITVGDLIDTTALKKESNDCVVNSTNKPCVKDPRDNSSLDNESIKLTKKDKRVTAQYQYKSSDSNTCSK